jgi:hypothetical protein
LAKTRVALYCGDGAAEKESVMSDNDTTGAVTEAAGPLRHFRMDRRAVLASLATGAGAVMFASRASAAHAHAHGVVAAAAAPADAALSAGSGLQFLDRHAFDTLASLAEQIVPGSRAVGVSEFLDRLLAVESTETQRGCMQAIGAFEAEARAAHGAPWKSLTAEQANALLTKISTRPEGDASRQAFDRIKGAVAETYYSTEIGMKELGWNGSVTFAPPSICG